MQLKHTAQAPNYVSLEQLLSVDPAKAGWQCGPMKDAFVISRALRAFDPNLAQDFRARAHGVDRHTAEFLAAISGSSPYLSGLIQREYSWLTVALDAPHAALLELLSAVRSYAPDELRSGLREAKRRVALMTALCDLAGCWSLEQVTTALTEFAQAAVDVALKAEVEKLVRRGKLPGMTEVDVETAAGLGVFAMGKMGAYELNYSSDIDLICLFDETRFDRSDFGAARQALVRATRNMCATLSELTGEGYVFRTDLRLRPDPSVTPVALAMVAAERYYESLGRTWERAAYIKARTCAGDIAAGERFLETLTPFVWRRHLDFAAIEDAHAMRLRIRESKGTGGPVAVQGHDMKLGRGGIREIEFFTQTRQLIAGGRDPGLRVRGTVEGLAALAERNWIEADTAAALTDHYRYHRAVEHRIQMVHDAQTHRMPKSAEGLGRVACLMGQEPEALCRDIAARLDAVHELTEGFFAPPGLVPQVPRPDLPEELDRDIIARWRSYPALRSDRGARIFDRLKPELFSRLAKTANPSETLLSLDGFLRGLPAGVQLFSLFEANPQLIDLLVDVLGTSPALAEHLSRNAQVFDAVLTGGFFNDWPGREMLQAELAAILERERDYESQLDAARAWKKEWHFRTGVHHLRGLINADEAARQYADLADAAVAAILPIVEMQFAAKHGPAPGRGSVVLAMGSLGSGRLNAQSDLDLIVIYDAAGAEISEGRRPLAVRSYFARLTQALVTALTAPMAQGRLYEVDMRLRPSGNQGPVATSWASFTHYQKEEAWVWEHLALTRARIVAGSPELAQDIEEFCGDLLARPQDWSNVAREVAEMRDRLAAAKTPAGIWDAKTGAGRMMDIELIAQTGSLLSGRATGDVDAGLSGAASIGFLSTEQAKMLQQAYRLFWSVQAAGRLIAGQGLSAVTEGEGGAQFLLRSTGFGDLAALKSHLEQAYATCAAIICEALKRNEKGQPK